MQDITDLLNQRKSIYQKRIDRAEKQEQQARTILNEDPDREDIREDLQVVIKLQDRYSALVDFIEELQEMYF